MSRLATFVCVACAAAACTACEQTSPNPTAAPTSSTSGLAPQPNGMRSPFAPKSDGPGLGPPAEQYAVGSEARARDYRMTVHGVGPCTVEPHFRPKAGTIKFGVDVEITSSSQREVPANPLYARLVDSEKETYSATLAGCAPVLTATRLHAGEHARGTITFDVPETAHGLVMTYAPFIVGSGTQQLEFALGR